MSADSAHPLDEQLATLLQRLGGTTEYAPLTALVKYVSQRTRDGVIAAPLKQLAGFSPTAVQDLAVVGKEGDYKPLILSTTHAWLYRYWLYEKRLAEAIQARLDTNNVPPLDDLQQFAVNLAQVKHFLIIAGGPGTGKTTTVTRILAHLLENGTRPERILLAAPTGKAAMRMQEAIRITRERLALPSALAERIPDQASTLHRLLGYIPNRVGFKHHVHNPLPADVVIVDEASMVDISLMTHLLEAVPNHAKLILLGDKDQLASVETGSIFRDLCVAPALQTHTVVLQRSYRFGEADGIGQLAQAIRDVDETRLLAVLHSDEFPNVSVDETSKQLNATHLRDGWADYIAAINTQNKASIFATFNQLRILTPLRKGKQGVEGLNSWADKVMQRLLPEASFIPKPWYIGRPIMVTQNDYRQNLFNGDIGIALLNENKELRVYFPTESGQFRAVAPIRLPTHETAWAMTIHKSQGSEFDKVLMLLPDAEELSLIGRELLYTGITRAKQSIHIITSHQTLRRALHHVSPPASCLATRLG